VSSQIFFGDFGLSVAAVNYGPALIAGIAQETLLNALQIRATLAGANNGALTDVTLLYISA